MNEIYLLCGNAFQTIGIAHFKSKVEHLLILFLHNRPLAIKRQSFTVHRAVNYTACAEEINCLEICNTILVKIML